MTSFRSLELLNEEHCMASAHSCLQAKLHRDLIDFDAHLDDCSNDYWNQALNQRIDDLCGAASD